MNKKVFIFLPDGVGLRNFALTRFKEIGESNDYDIVYWNNTVFSLKQELGYDEVFIENHHVHPATAILARARKRIELNIFDKKYAETVYNTYNFPQPYNGLKNAFKSILVDLIVFFGSHLKGLKLVRNLIGSFERRNPKYQYCKQQLLKHKPDFIFCTNQRPTQAIAPILAAKDLGIPTATFIFSWDNLPKATTLVEPEYYFVWSEHMKNEVLKYCPYVPQENIFVTGTPQFESHFDTSLLLSRASFFEKYGLDTATRYICYSGDDIVTSPLDQYYLEDLALSVRELNQQGYNIAIIYRKCPVDFTTRYDEILQKYNDIITVIDPVWRPVGTSWNEIIPTKVDFALQANICEHTEFVANVASSMVFDFVVHGKPCLFFDYEQPQLRKGIRDIGQNYKYIHFRSMPSKDAALWVYNKGDLTRIVREIIDAKITSVPEGLAWFKTIVGDDPTRASTTIWNCIDNIINKRLA